MVWSTYAQIAIVNLVMDLKKESVLCMISLLFVMILIDD